MPLESIKFKPGIVSVETAQLNQGNWASGTNIRFFQGLAQKDGGFALFAMVQDVPRSLRAWRALSGLFYLASSGSQRITIISSTQTFDITPLTIADTIPISLSTNIGSPNIVSGAASSFNISTRSRSIPTSARASSSGRRLPPTARSTRAVDDCEPPTCAFCDGHHGSVCPVEEPGYFDTREDEEERYFS